MQSSTARTLPPPIHAPQTPPNPPLPTTHKTAPQDVLERPFATVTYTEAVRLLLASGHKFDYPVSWGLDLQSEHERLLSETVGALAVCVQGGEWGGASCVGGCVFCDCVCGGFARGICQSTTRLPPCPPAPCPDPCQVLDRIPLIPPHPPTPATLP